jgi:hypothetical protein
LIAFFGASNNKNAECASNVRRANNDTFCRTNSRFWKGATLAQIETELKAKNPQIGPYRWIVVKRPIRGCIA